MDQGTGAKEASRIAIELMGSSAETGLPALSGATRHATQSLDLMDKQGLPSFVDKGYRAASTAALEQSVSDANAARVQTLTGKLNPSKLGAYSGAAGALAREQAGIAVSKAAAGVSQRNQLLNVLMGGGAAGTNLGTSFGQLTNRGLAAGLGSGNGAYEAVIGGASAVSPLLLQMLAKPQNSTLSYAQNRAGSGQLLFPMG